MILSCSHVHLTGIMFFIARKCKRARNYWPFRLKVAMLLTSVPPVKSLERDLATVQLFISVSFDVTNDYSHLIGTIVICQVMQQLTYLYSGFLL
jgi:hypothetical protein